MLRIRSIAPNFGAAKGPGLLDSIIRYLVMLNSSINFIIYCFVGPNFRQTLIRSLQPYICKPDKQVEVQLVRRGEERSVQCEVVHKSVDIQSEKETFLLVSEC